MSFEFHTITGSQLIGVSLTMGATNVFLLKFYYGELSLKYILSLRRRH